MDFGHFAKHRFPESKPLFQRPDAIRAAKNAGSAHNPADSHAVQRGFLHVFRRVQISQSIVFATGRSKHCSLVSAPQLRRPAPDRDATGMTHGFRDNIRNLLWISHNPVKLDL